MGYHILSIDSPQCSLSCKNGQVTCRVEGEDKVRTIPLEDVASILITSFSANLHSNLLIEAARHGVSLILCDRFMPISLVLPANRSTDTLLTRSQLDLDKRERDTLWRRTVDAKCRNQLLLAEHLAPQDQALADLRHYAKGKHEHKEAICAKLHWEIFGRAMGETNFTRDRGDEGINALLNYGYAVLLSTTLHKLFGVGLDPTFGIFHATREHATPLAYDLMEPFRPCVDWRVAQWVQKQQASELATSAEGLTVTKEFRAWVTAFPLVKVEYLEMELEVRGVIEGVVRSFRRALLENKTTLYKPWTPSDTKWAGC